MVFLQAIGCEVVDTEMNKDGQNMAPYLGTGITVMFIFVCITISGSALYFNRLTKTVRILFNRKNITKSSRRLS